MRAEMGSISHPRLPRDDDTKRKSNRKHSASRTSASRSTPTPSRPSRLPLRFSIARKPFTAAKKNKVGRIILREKKIGIQRRNDRVPCSSALGVVFRVRPPYVCKSHDECECERCSKQSALYRCFCVGFLEFLHTFWVLAKSNKSMRVFRDF